MNYYNYFTEIEEHFVRRRGKHLLLSPMDWALIAAWREAGIPLQVALRGIDIAMDGFFARQHRGYSKVNSLCYCHDAVMEEYTRYRDAHVGESADFPQTAPDGTEKKDEPETDEIREFLSARIDEIKALSTKQYLGSVLEAVLRALSRLQEIHGDLESGARPELETVERDLKIIDELLITELRAAVASEQSLEWEKEAKKELKIYRKRLPRETYEKILDNFLRDKIRRKFDIGELSLFRL
jgi:hypothetical protein